MAPSYSNVLIAGVLLLGGALAACAPTESAGECTSSKPCTARGEVCDVSVQECVAQDLDVDATSDKDAPTSFSNVALPFFRGEVCMPTRVQPGDTIPVSINPCLHPCIDAGGFTFKKQFSCQGSFCKSAVIQMFSSAAAMASGCPKDAFASFDRSMCVYPMEPIGASAGPFVINGEMVRGNGEVEIPFLTNDDAAEIRGGASTDAIWNLINKYPPSEERVFAVSMDGANPAAPADCVADKSLCDCREIGF